MKKLHFIVNGEDVFVPSFDADTLGAARGDALAISRNTARAPEEWELRDANGVRLDVDDLAALHFGRRIFCTLAIAAGGPSQWATRPSAREHGDPRAECSCSPILPWDSRFCPRHG